MTPIEQWLGRVLAELEPGSYAEDVRQELSADAEERRAALVKAGVDEMAAER